jgi:heme exporter protein C
MKRSLAIHYLAGWLLVLGVLGLVCFYVPRAVKADELGSVELGSTYLIFFFHFPSAFNCLLLFIAAGAASAAYLGRGSPGADRAARAAVEVGVLACTIAMVTGAIWAKQAWGQAWVFQDARLLTVAVMWFTYLGYLALRTAIDSPAQRARFAAVFGILALVNIPIVHFAIKWFGRLSHPPEIGLDPRMRITMWSGAFAFLVLYSAFWRSRVLVGELQDRIARIEEHMILKGK